MPEPQRQPNRNRRLGERRIAPRPGAGTAMWYVLGVLLLLALGNVFFPLQGGDTISYSEFKTFVRQNRVQEVTIGEDRITGKFRPLGNDKERPFSVIKVEDPKLTEELDQHGIKYKGEVSSRWLGELVSWVLPLIFIVALWTFFFRRMGGAEGGVMSFARSRAKIYADDDVKVSFND